MGDIMISPWEFFFKDFGFDREDRWDLIKHTNYPMDMWEDENGLHIEMVTVSATKDEIKIETKDNNILKLVCNRVKVDKAVEDKKNYYVKKISRKDFELEIKIQSKFDIDKLVANMKDGLLSIDIPIKPENKPKQIKIG